MQSVLRLNYVACHNVICYYAATELDLLYINVSQIEPVESYNSAFDCDSTEFFTVFVRNIL